MQLAPAQVLLNLRSAKRKTQTRVPPCNSTHSRPEAPQEKKTRVVLQPREATEVNAKK